MAIVIHEIKGNLYAYDHWRSGETVVCDYLGRAGGGGAIYSGTKEYHPGEETTIHEGTAHELGEEKTEKEIIESAEAGTEVGVEPTRDEGVGTEGGELEDKGKIESGDELEGIEGIGGSDTVHKPTEEERQDILETTQDTVRQSGQSEPKLMKKGMQFIDILMNKMLPAAGKMKTNQPGGSGTSGIQDTTRKPSKIATDRYVEPAPEQEPEPNEDTQQEGS